LENEDNEPQAQGGILVQDVIDLPPQDNLAGQSERRRRLAGMNKRNEIVANRFS
jgi:hypothetical protein